MRKVHVTHDQDGKVRPVSVATGGRYQFRLGPLSLRLERRYHDDAPVQGAPFELELADGSVVKGTTNAKGEAFLPRLRSAPKRVRFGPDARDYRMADSTPNPEYQAELSDAGADALVRQRDGA